MRDRQNGNDRFCLRRHCPTLFELAQDGSCGLSTATNPYHKGETRTARRPGLATFLFVILCFVLIKPLPALAQLGRLVVTVTSPRPGSTVNGTTTVNASVTIVGL